MPCALGIASGHRVHSMTGAARSFQATITARRSLYAGAGQDDGRLGGAMSEARRSHLHRCLAKLVAESKKGVAA